MTSYSYYSSNVAYLLLQGKVEVLEAVWWENQSMHLVIGVLVTVIVCLAALIVFILCRKHVLVVTQPPTPPTQTKAPTVCPSPIYSSLPHDASHSNSSHYADSSEYSSPLMLPHSPHYSQPAHIDWSSFFPPPPSSTPPLPHILPPPTTPSTSRPHCPPPTQHYASSHIRWQHRNSAPRPL